MSADDEKSNVGSDAGSDSPRSGEPSTVSVPAPGGAGSPKVWPGTWALGKDEEAHRESADDWVVKDGRKHLRTIRTLSEPFRSYKYLEMLGRGAQGYVFKMKDQQSGKIVAVKCFSKRRLKEDQERNCLRNPAIWHEYQLLKTVGDHPGIVEVEKLVMETDSYFYVPMEFVDGHDVHHVLWPRGQAYSMDKPPIDARRMKALFRGVMEALTYCHDKYVAHRDLKPSNILVLEDKQTGALKTKIMDFGLGALVPKTPTGDPMEMRRPVGTTAWCAPEVLEVFGELMRSERHGGGGGMGPEGRAGTMWQTEQGLGYYARPADIWSSGVLLWEMMTIDHLFHRPGIAPREQGATENRLVRKWVAMPESLEPYQQQFYKKLPSGCQELLKKMLNPDYQKRPTARAVFEDPWLQSE